MNNPDLRRVQYVVMGDALPHRERQARKQRDPGFGTDVFLPTAIAGMLWWVAAHGAVVAALRLAGLPYTWEVLPVTAGVAALMALRTFAVAWTDFRRRSDETVVLRATDYQQLPPVEQPVAPRVQISNRPGGAYQQIKIGKIELRPAAWRTLAGRLQENEGRLTRAVMDFSVDGVNRAIPNLTRDYAGHVADLRRLGFIDGNNQLTPAGEDWFYDEGWAGEG